MTGLEIRGFYLLVGALLCLLFLSRQYRGIVVKEKPDITPVRKSA